MVICSQNAKWTTGWGVVVAKITLYLMEVGSYNFCMSVKFISPTSKLRNIIKLLFCLDCIEVLEYENTVTFERS